MRLGRTVASGARLDEREVAEVKQVSQQAVISMVSELATPLQPVLSWFNDGGARQPLATALSQSSPPIASVTKVSGAVNPRLALAKVPLKCPPCKRCPALGGGLCQCAAKKFSVRH